MPKPPTFRIDPIFGDNRYSFKKTNLDDRLNITEADKLLIGEFIRCNHPRIAHEVALKGFIGKENEILKFAQSIDESRKKIVSIVGP